MLHCKGADINANAIKGAVVSYAVLHGANFTRIEGFRTIALHKIFRDDQIFSGDHIRFCPRPGCRSAEYRRSTLSPA